MPVTVQLPGYNHNAPAVGLAQAIGAGFGAYKDYNQAQTAKAQSAGMEQANEQAKTEFATKQNMLKAMTTPSTFSPDGSPLALNPVVENRRQAGLADVLSIQKAGLLNSGDTAGLIQAIKDPNQTAMGIDQILEPLKATAQPLAVEKLKADALKASSNARTGPQIDRNSKGIADDYLKGVSQYKQVQDDIARIENTLNTKDKNGKPFVAPQQIGDVNLAVSRMYSPNHQSDATVSATEYESAPAEFAAALQKYLANPQDSHSRALLDHILDQARHIGNASNRNALKQLDDIDAGNQNLVSPDSAKTAATISKQLRSRFSKQYPEVGENAPASRFHEMSDAQLQAAYSKIAPKAAKK